MLCYRDRTFCSFEGCKKFTTCDRACTDEIKRKANEWWVRSGGKPDEAPVSFYTGKPTCHSGFDTVNE